MKQCRNSHNIEVYGRTKYGHCKECTRLRSKRWRTAHYEQSREAVRNSFRKRKYHITNSEYHALLEKQNFRCAVCEKPTEQLKTLLAVDHDHKTGQVRGLLCVNCNNKVVKVAEDYAALIPKAFQYLQIPGEK